MLHDFIPHGRTREDVMKGQLLPLSNIIVSMYIIMSAADSTETLFGTQVRMIREQINNTKARMRHAGLSVNDPVYQLPATLAMILDLIARLQAEFIGAPTAVAMPDTTAEAYVLPFAQASLLPGGAASKSSGAAVGGRRRGISGGKSRKKRRRRGGKRTRRK